MRLACLIVFSVAMAGCSVLRSSAPPRPAPFRGGLAFVDATYRSAPDEQVLVQDVDARQLHLTWAAVSADVVELSGHWHAPCVEWTTYERAVSLEPGWVMRLTARVLARRADEQMYRHDRMRWMLDPSRPPIGWGTSRVQSHAGDALCSIGPAAHVELELRCDEGTRTTVALDAFGTAEVVLAGDVLVVAPGAAGAWVVRPSRPLGPDT